MSKTAELPQSAIFRNVVEFEVNFNHFVPPNSAKRGPIDLTFSQTLHLVKFPKILISTNNLIFFTFLVYLRGLLLCNF